MLTKRNTSDENESTRCCCELGGSFSRGMAWSKGVENSGSTARDHLSNERTLLSWIRTAIAVIALGLAIATLVPQHGGTALGVCLLVLGGAIMMCSGARYFEIANALESGGFRISHGGVVLLLVLAMLLVVGCIVLLFVQSFG
jgi:putative membrane protein